jgi:DNA mismatch endonuclease, patch repair protein
MTDSLNAELRSQNMKKIGSKNTKAEVLVRRSLFRLGYRFRLHRKDLPGKPDIVFPGRRKVIFVHGCFWHQHQTCREGRVPGSRQEYWVPKLTRNIIRDSEHAHELQELGWGVLVIWECETTHLNRVMKTITEFLGPQKEESATGLVH